MVRNLNIFYIVNIHHEYDFEKSIKYKVDFVSHPLV